MIRRDLITVWFSCGAASAVAAKKTIDIYGKSHDIRIVNTPIREEHEDNQRFLKDVEEWLQYPIETAIAEKYPNSSIYDVFEDRQYISGIKGAPCTMCLKKQARYEYETRVSIDQHVLGFTIDEWRRQKKFNSFERANTLPVLVAELIEKVDTFKIIKKAGIKLPFVYKLGLPNANCIGCVKSTSPDYWNLIRIIDLLAFNKMAAFSRKLGVKLVRVKGNRIFLDELKPTDKGRGIKSWECGIFCDD